MSKIVYKNNNYNFDKQLMKRIDESILRRGCNVSCGVVELQNVGFAFKRLKNGIDKKLLAAHFKHYLTRYCNNRYAFKIVSIPKQGNDRELVSLLDTIAKTKTDWKKNPNSGNDIKIWTL